MAPELYILILFASKRFLTDLETLHYPPHSIFNQNRKLLLRTVSLYNLKIFKQIYVLKPDRSCFYMILYKDLTLKVNL